MSSRLKQMSIVILIIFSFSYFQAKMNSDYVNAEVITDSTVKLLIIEKAETKEERLELRFNSTGELPKTHGVDKHWSIISGLCLIIIGSKLINKNKTFRRKIK